MAHADAFTADGTQLCSVRCRIAFTGLGQPWTVVDGGVPKPEESELGHTNTRSVLGHGNPEAHYDRKNSTR